MTSPYLNRPRRSESEARAGLSPEECREAGERCACELCGNRRVVRQWNDSGVCLHPCPICTQTKEGEALTHREK